MAIDLLVAPFLRVEIFQGLAPHQIEAIARQAERVVLRPGDVIVNGNFTSDGAVLIASGEAVIAGERGLHDTADTVPTGSLLNEMAMLIETDLSLVVFARSTVRALKISRERLRAIMIEDPFIAEHFTAKISRRLQDFVDGFGYVERTFGSADGRRAAAQTG